MCTAVTYNTRDHYFGRNFDLEISYHEEVVITPRRFPLPFRRKATLEEHYAMVGMAVVAENYPLYYDATNEKGLSAASLNFPGYAEYQPEKEGADNITPFEFIPWILAQCKDVGEARKLVERMNMAAIPFSDNYPLTPLHWIIADKEESIVVEPVREGLKIYDDPVGILTNSPTFDIHLFQLNNYMGLSKDNPANSFAPGLELKAYSRGMGTMGLPGDLSSVSRFVKAAYTRLNSISGESESESISQFFQILGSVAQQRGCVQVEEGKYEITLYSSCCNTDKGIYYYRTYENSQITGIDMGREDLGSQELIVYPLIQGQQIKMQN